MARVKWMDALSLPWDLRQGPFRAFFPPEGKEREVCKQMITTHHVLDDLPLEKAQWASCQETRSGKLVASVLLLDGPTYDAYAKRTAPELHFTGVVPEYLPHLGVFLHLCIHRDYEETSAVQTLLLHCLTELLKAGGQGALMRCSTDHLLAMKRIGFRPAGAPAVTDKGTGVVPMIFVPDRDYLSIIHSPVLPLLRRLDFAQYRSISAWYQQLVRDNADLRVGTAFLPEDDNALTGHQTVTDGLSEVGREIFLKYSMVRHCRAGEVLIAAKDTSRAFGFVQKGIAKVMIGSTTVIHLSEGDIFGEIAFILETPRTARVVAAGDDTEVILFDQSALDLLQSPTDRMVVWRNLARILAQRLVMTNQLLG